MTIIGGKDRCDYRAMSIDELIEESIYNPNAELCIVLGERATAMSYKLRHATRETEDLRNVLAMASGANLALSAEVSHYRENRNG